jgi:hypothetical protein
MGILFLVIWHSHYPNKDEKILKIVQGIGMLFELFMNPVS